MAVCPRHSLTTKLFEIQATASKDHLRSVAFFIPPCFILTFEISAFDADKLELVIPFTKIYASVGAQAEAPLQVFGDLSVGALRLAPKLTLK